MTGLVCVKRSTSAQPTFSLKRLRAPLPIMGISMIDIQRTTILDAIKNATRGDWKILVVDQSSWKLILNVVKEDDILSEKIAEIKHIEQKRSAEREMDAIYFLTPEPHIVDCIMADFEQRRYRRAILLWTGCAWLELHLCSSRED